MWWRSFFFFLYKQFIQASHKYMFFQVINNVFVFYFYTLFLVFDFCFCFCFVLALFLFLLFILFSGGI